MNSGVCSVICLKQPSKVKFDPALRMPFFLTSFLPPARFFKATYLVQPHLGGIKLHMWFESLSYSNGSDG